MFIHLNYFMYVDGIVYLYYSFVDLIRRTPGSGDISVLSCAAGALIQEMIWQRSAKSLLLCGPSKICEALAKEGSIFSCPGQAEKRSCPSSRINGLSIPFHMFFSEVARTFRWAASTASKSPPCRTSAALRTPRSR